MYYFGYGSSLKADALSRAYLPSARFLMKGYLPNYAVQFRMWSEKLNGGISSIAEAPGEIVQGALYTCGEADLNKLDYMPGVFAPEYKREIFMILGEDGQWYAAGLYRLWDLKGPFPPAREYVETMFAGAKEIGVSADYLEKIEGWLRESI